VSCNWSISTVYLKFAFYAIYSSDGFSHSYVIFFLFLFFRIVKIYSCACFTKDLFASLTFTRFSENVLNLTIISFAESTVFRFQEWDLSCKSSLSWLFRWSGYFHWFEAQLVSILYEQRTLFAGHICAVWQISSTSYTWWTHRWSCSRGFLNLISSLMEW
jgi:hypothetical protein